MTLFNRVIQTKIGKAVGEGIDVSDLRVSFTIYKAIDPTSNSCRITIYNMAENTRNQIREIDDVITISAGYADDAGAKLMFTGDILKINHKVRAPDIISEVEAGDGAKTLRETRISISFREGAEVKSVLEDIASKLDITLRPLPDDIQGQYIHGFSFAGSAKEGLNKVTERIDLVWSVQNNELQILKRRAAIKLVPKQISYSTGLLEAPEKLTDLKANLEKDKPKPGYSLRMLLLPDVEPGQTVNIDAGLVSGLYRVDLVTHVGDNEGFDFITNLEVSEYSE